MSRNLIKIKSDLSRNALTFYIMNENQKWCPVSSSSVLSRKEFVDATIERIASKLIHTIDLLYNIRDRGVDIYFEGTDSEFDILSNTLRCSFGDKNIRCIVQRTMIAVAGKIQSGKTTLINELMKFKGMDCCFNNATDIPTCKSDDSTVEWLEIPGIDIGIENVVAAQKSFDELVKTGITTFIYCLRTNKIEISEESLINHVVENYPSVRVIVALTQYIDEDTTYAEKLSQQLNGIRVIPILAKDLNTRQGTIASYGLNSLDEAIFEGR